MWDSFRIDIALLFENDPINGMQENEKYSVAHMNRNDGWTNLMAAKTKLNICAMDTVWKIDFFPQLCWDIIDI